MVMVMTGDVRRGQVHHIHHMMAVLLVFKTLSMLFESIRYHYLRLTGAAEAWSIVYYLFAFLKGITLFVVILLIGMGWSLIKPFLNGRDKRIIFVVLTLQVKPPPPPPPLWRCGKNGENLAG